MLKEEPEIEKNKISINWVPPSVCLDSLLYLSLFWKEYRLKQIIVICYCVCPKIVIIFRCCKIIYLLIYWYFLNCFFHFLIWYFFLKFVILKMLLLVCLENASQFSLARIYCLCPFSLAHLLIHIFPFRFFHYIDFIFHYCPVLYPVVFVQKITYSWF